MATKAQRTHPCRPMEQLAPRLWQVTGPLPGLALTRTMAIYRLNDGGLLIHSAIAMDEAGMTALEALGQPRWVIVPSPIHRGDANFYKSRYPQMRTLCPQAVMDKVGRHVAIDEAAEPVLEAEGIRCHLPPGVRPGELTYQLPVGDGVALIFTDLLFNMPHGRGFGGWLMRVLGSSGFFGLTRIGRLFSLKDAGQFSDWLASLADIPELNVICVAHGDAIREHAPARLREAAGRLC